MVESGFVTSDLGDFKSLQASWKGKIKDTLSELKQQEADYRSQEKLIKYVVSCLVHRLVITPLTCAAYRYILSQGRPS